MAFLSAYRRWQIAALDGFDGGMRAYIRRISGLQVASPRVLHFGCGRDINDVRTLLGGASQVVGVDIDRDALRDYPGACWHIDGTFLPFADAAFDLVVSEFVLEHLERPQPVFNEILRVLAGGGVFISVAPNKWSYKSLAARLVPNRMHAALVRLLRPESKRNDEDVYPTRFRANSLRDLQRLATVAGGELRLVDYLNNGPTWFRLIPGLFELGLVAHKLMDLSSLAHLRCNIVAEIAKPIGPPRAAELVVCIVCRGPLQGAIGSEDLTCSRCGRIERLRDGVYGVAIGDP